MNVLPDSFIRPRHIGELLYFVSRAIVVCFFFFFTTAGTDLPLSFLQSCVTSYLCIYLESQSWEAGGGQGKHNNREDKTLPLPPPSFRCEHPDWIKRWLHFITEKASSVNFSHHIATHQHSFPPSHTNQCMSQIIQPLVWASISYIITEGRCFVIMMTWRIHRAYCWIDVSRCPGAVCTYACLQEEIAMIWCFQACAVMQPGMCFQITDVWFDSKPPVLVTCNNNRKYVNDWSRFGILLSKLWFSFTYL